MQKTDIHPKKHTHISLNKYNITIKLIYIMYIINLFIYIDKKLL